MSKINNMVWQTDDCVYDGHTWGYAPNTPVKPTNRIVDELIDIVSKRGVLMLSFAPKADGSFPEDQIRLANELGAWLAVCGEAIYKTRPWDVFGEGPSTNKKFLITVRPQHMTSMDWDTSLQIFVLLGIKKTMFYMRQP